MGSNLSHSPCQSLRPVTGLRLDERQSPQVGMAQCLAQCIGIDDALAS